MSSRGRPARAAAAGARVARVVALVACGVGCGCQGQPASSGAPSASAAASSAAAPSVVRLRPYPSKVGRELRVEQQVSSALSVEFWQEDAKLGSNESTRSESFTRTLRVLGTVGGTPSKVRVTYDAYELRETPTRGAPRRSRELEGKTYVVDATDSPTRYAREDGEPVPEPELTALKGVHQDTGKVDALVEFLADKPLKVGTAIRLNAPLLSSVLGTGAGDLQSGSLRLTETGTEEGRAVARFDLQVTTRTQESGGLEITSHLTGQVVLAVEPAETLRVKVKGVLEASGMGRNERGLLELRGGGSSELQRTVTPLQAATP